MNISELSVALDSLGFSTQLIGESKNTLSISGVSHLENVWSKLYAYFLDENNSHGLKSLFKDSLKKIILKKTGRNIEISGGVVKCEHATIEGNRIDILIQTSGHSVIIENKVFHRLNNDLDDYWQSIEGAPDSKVGIILTLTPILTNNSNYINITHLEWCEEIEKNIKGELALIILSDPPLFRDFINNIKEVSNTMNKSEMDFYLSKREQINPLYRIANDYKKWLQTVFNDAAFVRSLGNYNIVHNDRENCKYRYSMYKIADTDELVVTVFYEFLWHSKRGEAKLCFFVQPIGNWLEKAIANETVVRQIADKHRVPSRDRNKDFWHCASVEIEVAENVLQSEHSLKDIVTNCLVYDKYGLRKAASEISDLLSSHHKPTYQWPDVIDKLKELLTDNNDVDVEHLNNYIHFISYDVQNQIVILDVDKRLWRNFERYYYDYFMMALKFVFGEMVKCSIVC